MVIDINNMHARQFVL